MSVPNDTSYEMFACYHNIFIHGIKEKSAMIWMLVSNLSHFLKEFEIVVFDIVFHVVPKIDSNAPMGLLNMVKPK